MDFPVPLADGYGRDTTNHRERSDVLRDHGTGGDHCPFADLHPLEDDGGAGDPGPVSDRDRLVHPGKIGRINEMLGRDDLGKGGDVHIATDKDTPLGIKETIVANNRPRPDTDVPECKKLAISHDMGCRIDRHTQPAVDPLAEPGQRNPVDEEIAEVVSGHGLWSSLWADLV